MAFGQLRRRTSLESNIEVCYGLAVAMLGAGASADAAVLRAFTGLDPSDPLKAQRTKALAATREAAKSFLRDERGLGIAATPGMTGGLAHRLGNLTASEQAAFLLVYLGCYTLAEVAVLTDATPADVRRTMAAAARKLVQARRHGASAATVSGDASDMADALAAMQTASRFRLIIEQATGLLMEADKCGAQEAQASLVAEASRTGRTLRAVATDVVLNAASRQRGESRQTSEATTASD